MSLNTSCELGVTNVTSNELNAITLEADITKDKKSRKRKVRNEVDIITYRELSRKWAIPILKDLFLGAKRFTDFLAVPRSRGDHLSNRVLADQLENLIYYGFVIKDEENGEYSLTQMGLDLNKMLYEKIMWAIKYGVISRDDPYFKGKNIEEVFGITKEATYKEEN